LERAGSSRQNRRCRPRQAREAGAINEAAQGATPMI